METKRNDTKSIGTEGLFPKSPSATCLPPSRSSYTVSARVLNFLKLPPFYLATTTESL